MSDTQQEPFGELEAPSEDRELAQSQLADADPEALAGKKDDIKTGVVDFFGEKFHVAEKVGAIPMLMWSKAADTEVDGHEGMAAVWLMVEDVIHEKEFKRFVRTGLKNKAGSDDLFKIINSAMELISGNPTEQQDGSASS
jgi:hypothetical protein